MKKKLLILSNWSFALACGIFAIFCSTTLHLIVHLPPFIRL